MTNRNDPFTAPISRQIWGMKYQHKTPAVMQGDTVVEPEIIHDEVVEDSWRRIARALAEAEPEEIRAEKEEDFYQALSDFKYLPAGRITAGAGTKRNVTLFNCFVMGTIPDSMPGIFDMLKEAALTMQQGGGIGYDFSTIRPKGAPVIGVGSDASGPLSFMDVWNSMCKTIMSAGSRRGAMMATMRDDHPDIEDFITAKQDSARLRHFNLSVLVSDALMEAVKHDGEWHLTWKGEIWKTMRARDLWDLIMDATYNYAEPGVIFIDRINERNPLRYIEKIAATNPCFTQDTLVWTKEGPVAFKNLVGRDVEVRTQLDDNTIAWRKMSDIRKTQENADLVEVRFENGSVRCTPSHVFYKTDGTEVEAQNLESGMTVRGLDADTQIETRVESVTVLETREDVYCGSVEETHKFFIVVDGKGVLVHNCGEQPLPPYGACLLGSINLARLIANPFTDAAEMDEEMMSQLVATAVRMMDNVVDVSNFALEEQRKEAKAKRRIGLGVTGLADALLMLKLTYGTEKAARQTEAWMRRIQNAAYRASVELAKEKGSFPLFDKEGYLASPTIQDLDDDIKADIAQYGIRNALLTSIAPTGTISLYAGNVSSGVEPVFAYSYTRKVLQKDGSRTEEEVVDYAVQMYREKFGVEEDSDLPDYFVSAQTLKPLDHVRMQAAAQKWVDSSISKTINCPEDIPFEDFKEVYMEAYETGCKGCTTYRPNDVTGSVLSVEKKEEPKVETPEESVQKPVQEHTLLERPEVLEGRTYKLKWPKSQHAYYVTINDAIDDEDDFRRPFEIFIVTKSTESQQWIAAITRMISAVFRRGGDVSFVAQELREVFDPEGGAWVSGRYVQSLVSAIGDIIDRHMKATGFLEIDAQDLAPKDHGAEISSIEDRPAGKKCPACGEFTYVKEAGCDKCLSCGHSKCQ